MHQIPVQIKILPHGSGVPAYATPGSAGLDLMACIAEPLTLHPGMASVLIPTGISVYLENPAYAGLILPRSGLGHKQGVNLGNGSGLIDATYQGELFVSACVRIGHPSIEIKPGDKIAQLAIIPVMHAVFNVVENFSETTERGTGGFGSTGVNTR